MCCLDYWAGRPVNKHTNIKQVRKDASLALLQSFIPSFFPSFLLLMPIMFWTSSCIERLYIWRLSLKISEANNWLHVQNDNLYILIGAVLSGVIRERITSIITESSMSLSPAVSPSACSLKMSSGLLYGLRASRCVTLSLSGRSCKSPVLFLFEA